MTSLITSVVNLFCRLPQQRLIRETHECFVAEYSLNCLSSPSLSEFSRALQAFPDRDLLELFITINSSDPLIFSTEDQQLWQETLEDLATQQASLEHGDSVTLKVSITKRSSNNTISVYNLDQLLAHFKQRSIQECFAIFADYLISFPTVKFVCLDMTGSIATHSMAFGPPSNIFNEMRAAHINRQQILDKRNVVAYFFGGVGATLIPDDFHVTTIDGDIPTDLVALLSLLERVLSFIFLVNSTSLEPDGKVSFRLQGYKLVSGTIARDHILDLNWNCGFQLYQWAYAGGAVSDKIGLLRNIMTLHLDNAKIPHLDDAVYRSACSSHEIYLRENIAHYVEIRNKLTEYLINLKRSAREDSGRLSASLFQQLGAFLTFFLTALMVNAIQGGKFKAVFSRDVALISYVFLFGSGCFLFISALSLKRRIAYFRHDYDELRQQYLGLLDDEDLNGILDEKTYLTLPLKEVRSSACITGFFWIILLLVFAFVIHFLSATTSPSTTATVTTDRVQDALMMHSTNSHTICSLHTNVMADTVQAIGTGAVR